MSSIVKVLKLCCISGFDTLNLKKQNKKLNLSCFAVHDGSFANLDCFYGISAVFGQLTVLKCKKCLRGTDKVNISLLYSPSLGLSWEIVVSKLLAKFYHQRITATDVSILSTHISFGKEYCIEVDLTKRVATFVVLMLKAHSQVPMRSRLGSKQSWKSTESKIKISKNKSKRRKGAGKQAILNIWGGMWNVIFIQNTNERGGDKQSWK